MTDDAPDLPATDWQGQAIEAHEPDPGAGEHCCCAQCGSSQTALVGETAAADATKWEEFYRCLDCGAVGSLRVIEPTDEDDGDDA